MASTQATAHEHHSARPHPENVVLDIGEGFGALIIHSQAAMHGREIEISPEGEEGNRSHKEVLERRIAGAPAFTAVFDKLPAGRYTLWVDDTARAWEVEIRGGRVSELDWSDSLPERSDPLRWRSDSLPREDRR